MRLQPVIDRIDSRAVKQTGGALEFAGMTQAPGRLPALFVVPEAESAEPSRLSGAHDQRVTVTFSVVLVLEAVRATASAVAEQLFELTESVKRELVGWRHPDADGPTQYAGARLLGVEAGALAWALQFTTTHHLRKV